MFNRFARMATCLLIFVLAACSGVQAPATDSASQTSSTGVTPNEVATIGATASASSAASAAASSTPAASVTEALAANSATHEDPQDAKWDSAAEVAITLRGDAISVTGEGVTVDGSTATITAPGSYRLAGSLADGQIVVNSAAEGIVRLIFDGVEIRSSTSAAINVAQADEVLVVLAENTENLLSDAAAPVFATADTDEPNADLFSAADLTIAGAGALVVEGNYNDGIASKDGLVIASGTITVQAVDDGIRGKDYLVLRSGAITVEAQGDGLKPTTRKMPPGAMS